MREHSRLTIRLVALLALSTVVSAWACDPPGIWPRTLGEGDTVSGITNVAFSVWSETEVPGVDIYVDGKLLVSLKPQIPQTEDGYYEGTCEYEWDTSSVSDGPHEIYAKARAFEREDGVSETVTFTVSNEKPAAEEPEGTGAAEEGDAASDEAAS